MLKSKNKPQQQRTYQCSLEKNFHLKILLE